MGDIQKIPDNENIDNGKNPIQKLADKIKNGEVFVLSYTKSNGVNISAHTRSMPSK